MGNFIREVSSQTELSIGEIASVIKSIPAAFDKEKVIKELREELNLTDAEKERCARENPLQFDSAKGVMIMESGIEYGCVSFTR